MADQKNIAILIALGCLAFGLFIIAFIIFMVKYQRRMYAKDIKIKTIEFLSKIELFKASSEAEERGKERIARNLHDEINPLLTVLKQNLQKHRFDLQKNKFDAASFEVDFEIIDRAIEGIRSSSYDLIPSFMLDYGLLRSLEDHLRSINDAGTIRTTFHSGSGAADLLFLKQEQLNIYRASLEIINNILNHSGCTSLSLQVGSAERSLVFQFSYNGQGINNEEINTLSQGSGLGLKSLKARALILNAALHYEKSADLSYVKFTIPFKHE